MYKAFLIDTKGHNIAIISSNYLIKSNIKTTIQQGVQNVFSNVNIIPCFQKYYKSHGFYKSDTFWVIL